MSPLESWEFVAAAFAFLWVFWLFLNWLCDLVLWALAELEHASAGRSSGEALPPNRERGS